MIRTATPADSGRLVSLATATGLFAPDEADALLGGILTEFHAGKLGEGHHVRVADGETGEPAGWVYFAPAFKADGVWDLWWIGVDPKAQGKGIGDALLTHVESVVRESGARILIIETSSTPPLAAARGFYAKRGYRDCGRIPDYYGKGDDKVTFAKSLG